MDKVEPHTATISRKLNWLRAAVLGANDGIVSTAALIFGVAGAAYSKGYILTAGIAGLVAGAISMGLGEYISVSAQRDSEKAFIEKEKKELEANPEAEIEELAGIYQHKGISPETARKVAEELTAHDVLRAHLDAELGIDPDNLTNPWHAAAASALAFTCGSVIPIFMVFIASDKSRIPVTFGAVVIALVFTGTISAHVGGANKSRATMRVVVGGILAMVVTYFIGRIFGVSGI